MSVDKGTSKAKNPKISDFYPAEDRDKIFPGDYVQVIDNATQRVIIQGLISDDKRTWSPKKLKIKSVHEFSDEEILYSVDNKYYFKLDDERYTVKKLPRVFVDKEYIRKNYVLLNWIRYKDVARKDINMYLEHNVDEVDEEIVNIIRVLNKFSMHMKTVASCCGHGKEQPWITIQFNSSRSLEDFLNIFQPFKNKMRITTSRRNSVPREVFLENPYFPYCMVLVLRAKEVGDGGYKVLDEFATYLEKIIDVRNEAFKQLNEIMVQEEAV